MSVDDEYNKIIDWLYELHLFGIKFGLKKVEKLLEYLGEPQKTLRIIHVGGTNGKGSVCAVLSSILSNAGYKVGVNTSPHLSEFTERITINGKQITRQDVVKYAKLLGDVRERVNMETEYGYATYFEVVTAMALKYFADSDLDYVILEVGLGGTYDATNVVDPLLTIITDISLDHTEHLGTTLKSVAENKAGIIKPGRPVITSSQEREALDVILDACKNKKSKCYYLGKDFKFDLKSSSLDGITIDYQGIEGNFSNLAIPLLGAHQGINSALALCALEVLSGQFGLEISEETLRKGLAEVSWPGRLEIVQRSPLVILDGAHNPAGTKVLSDVLKTLEFKNLYLVFGCSEEKDISGLLKPILPLASKIFVTQANIRRSAVPDNIIKHLEGTGINTEIQTQVGSAAATAMAGAKKDDIICICGSLFVVGEAREYLTECRENGNDEPPKKRIHY